MSRVHIERPTRIGAKDKTAPALLRKKGLHLTLAYDQGLGLDLPVDDLMDIVRDAPESSRKSYEVEVGEVIQVGIKSHLEIASLAVALALPGELEDEIQYYSNELRLRPTEHPHITLQKDLPAADFDRQAERLAKRLSGVSAIELKPVNLRILGPKQTAGPDSPTVAA